MKKTISILLLLLTSSMLFASIDISTLSSSDRDIFLSKAITIQSEWKNDSFSALYSPSDTIGIVAALLATSTTKEDFRVFEGSKEIDKLTFFEKANQNVAVDIIKEEDKRVKTLHNWGWGLCATGLAAMFGGAIWEFTAPENSNTSLYRIIAISGGTVLSLCSLPLITVKPNYNLSVQFAINVADAYNQNLFDSLK